jgi:hypothetical protein
MASNFCGFHTGRKSWGKKETNWTLAKKVTLTRLARPTHSSICLCDTAPHAAEKTARGWAHSHGRGGRLNLRRGEEKHTTFRRSFDPRLDRNQWGNI